MTWFDEAFPRIPYQRGQPGSDQMLILVGYDIASPKRLHKVAKACEDFGQRVQYSFFECHLEPEGFDALWNRLLDLIDPDQGRLVAYRLDASSAKRTLTAETMACSQKVVCYLV